MAVDGLTPANVEGFAGLNLYVDPEELGFNGAIDARNVMLEPGRVRSRYGTSLLSMLASGWQVLQIAHYSTPGGSESAIVTTNQPSGPGAFAVRYPDGVTVASVASGWPAIQTIGTPTASYAYVTNSTTSSLSRFDGSTWTSVSPTNIGTSTVAALGLSPTDNRLALGGVGTNHQRVWFSDPGAPETFGANNWVDLNPGDGDNIQCAASWNNQLYVFKTRRFYVFYGNSSDSTGQPVFNYRPVDAGVGASSWAGATAGPDGVYILDRTGVYRTTGSVPVKISRPLDPFFIGAGSPLLSGTFQPGFFQGNSISWANGRLFVYVTSTTSVHYTFVWDPRLDAWTYWTASAGQVGFSAAGEFPSTNVQNSASNLLLGGRDGGLYVVAPAQTTDAGSAITTSYQSGFSDMGQPAREKTIRETELVGTGTVNLAYAREFGALDSPQSVTLGTTAARRGLDRHARAGELLSFQLSGAAPWSVNRVIPMLRETRGVGERTS